MYPNTPEHCRPMLAARIRGAPPLFFWPEYITWASLFRPRSHAATITLPMNFFRPILLLLILSVALFVPFDSSAQTTMYGMTSNGGAYSTGTIYSMTEAGTFTRRYDFFRNLGAGPKCDMIKATDGKLYGVTETGGTNGVGTIFSYDAATATYTTVYNMTSTGGSKPVRGLVQVGTKLYGMCSEGGTSNLGTLFDYNLTGGVFTKRVDFTGTANGSKPRGRLVLAANGSLYGTTYLGGANAKGVIFQFNPTTNAYTKRWDFTTATGSQPFAGLMKASNNLLYGVTFNGGTAPNNGGVLFSFNTTGPVYAVLHEFVAADGINPLAELTQATNGLIYGSASASGANSGGTLFSFNITGSVFTKLIDMAPATGSSPFGRMIQASNTLLYGLTNRGGMNDGGFLYSLNTSSNAYTPVAELGDFGMSDAWSGLIEEPAGTLYGACNDGGTTGSGALLKFVISSSTLTEAVAMSFAQGAGPKGRLLLASNGLFYGLTSGGGTGGTGIIFSFNPGTNVLTRLADLSGANGAAPLGTLAESGGKFYGVCNAGGASNFGTIFEFNPTGSVLTKKIDLSAITGHSPPAGLFKASNGRLYGLTTAGGSNSLGTLFEYVPATNTLTVHVDFDNTTGTQPDADLFQASNGLLYGTLSSSGLYSNGSMFSFNTGTNTFTKVYDFDGFQGGFPVGEIAQTANGKLYGTCREGGTELNGNIYGLDLNTTTYTEEYAFLVADGRSPEAGLVVGSDDKLYGACQLGGVGDLGTLFRYNPTTAAYAVLTTLTATDGTNPYNGMVRDVMASTPGVQLAMKMFLEGPLNTGTGQMNDSLRVHLVIPTTEPYTGLGYTQVGGGGGETFSASLLNTTGNNAIVDWVMIELRSVALPSPVVATRCALLQRDGDVVDVNGTSPVTFNVAAGNYKVAVRHRNHLACMTLNELALSSTPNSPTLDLTNGSVAMYGTEAQKTIGSYRALWAGNIYRDAPIVQLKYTGSNSDRDYILQKIGGVVPTNTASGYFTEDCNMDYKVKYTGSASDRDVILTNIGGVVPTNTRNEQLP